MKRLEALLYGMLGAVIMWLILTALQMDAIKQGQAEYYRMGRVDTMLRYYADQRN